MNRVRTFPSGFCGLWFVPLLMGVALAGPPPDCTNDYAFGFSTTIINSTDSPDAGLTDTLVIEGGIGDPTPVQFYNNIVVFPAGQALGQPQGWAAVGCPKR